MNIRSLKKDVDGFLDITVAITIGCLFAALMIVAYIIWTLRAFTVPAAPQAGTGVSTTAQNVTYYFIKHSTDNITGGFDSSVKILLVAVMVAILARLIDLKLISPSHSAIVLNATSTRLDKERRVPSPLFFL